MVTMLVWLPCCYGYHVALVVIIWLPYNYGYHVNMVTMVTMPLWLPCHYGYHGTSAHYLRMASCPPLQTNPVKMDAHVSNHSQLIIVICSSFGYQ